MMLVDLSLPIHPGMTTYPRPWHPYVEVTQLGRHGIEGRETRKLVMGTHTGTHIDAPRHFIEGGATVDEIALDKLFGPCVLLDFSGVPPLSQISTADIEVVSEGLDVTRVLLRFDWDRHLDTMDYYQQHPFLSLGAVQHLIDRGCVLIGMDSPSPDTPFSNDMSVHRRALSQGVVLVEYLCNLGSIPRDHIFDIVVAPLKIKEGDGAPARVFAVVG